MSAAWFSCCVHRIKGAFLLEFEPVERLAIGDGKFFTTQEIGKGSGLGLAQVSCPA